MGQQEIMDLLKHHKDQWYSTSQIHKLLNTTNLTSVKVCCARLRKHNMVKFKEVRSKTNKIIYVYSYKK